MMLEVKPRLIYRGGKPVGVQGIARDITGRDAAELELRHAQKLESVGPPGIGNCPRNQYPHPVRGR